MPEALTTRAASPPLSACAAAVATRLAGLLAELAAERPGPLADGAAFLRAFAEQVGPPDEPAAVPGLARLAHGLGLTPLEIDLVVLAGLPDEHEGYADVLRGLHPRSEPQATVALAAQLFASGAAARQALRATLTQGAAVRAGLLRVGPRSPFFDGSLQLAEALWPVLHGHEAWPEGLETVDDVPEAGGLAGWLAAADVARARRVLASGSALTLVVSADETETALARAAILAASAGRAFVRVRWPATPEAGLAHVVALHALARGAIPIVAVPDAVGERPAPPPAFPWFPGPAILCTGRRALRVSGGRPTSSLNVERLGPTERVSMWREVVPELGPHAERLAARYAVEPAVAVTAVRDARAAAHVLGRAPDLDDVGRSVRQRTAATIGSGIKVVHPTATWDHLVLRDDCLARLREAVARLHGQVRVLDEWRFAAGRPGVRGVRLLFAGPPGTGKTLSAEVLASELGTDLLVVDVSRVVSKWLGETEKNLAEVFDAAERTTAVLLFDEADALFGKRTEVSDAHDRYANLETAYLLSRLERFEGLTVLSTNLRQNIDPAFIRRLEFVVDFVEPDRHERERLWACHVPPTAPLGDDVRFRDLAELYPVSGALIRNASLAAAFQAAAEGTPIRHEHFVRAMQREYGKAGRAFPRS